MTSIRNKKRFRDDNHDAQDEPVTKRACLTDEHASHHSPPPEHAVPCILRISIDVLSLCSDVLQIVDLQNLYMCGNKQLCIMLTCGGVSTLNYGSRTLLELGGICTARYSSILKDRTRQERQSVASHFEMFGKSLRSVIIDGDQAPPLHYIAHSQNLVSLTISGAHLSADQFLYLPRILKHFSYDGNFTVHTLLGLPPLLESFTMRVKPAAERDPYFSLLDPILSVLPRGLTQLCVNCTTTDYFVWPSKFFPPELRSLSLNVFFRRYSQPGVRSNFGNLPRTLTKFSIPRSHEFDDDDVKDLPKGLLHLNINGNYHLTDASFADLPSHLQILNIKRNINLTKDNVTRLPTSLVWLECTVALRLSLERMKKKGKTLHFRVIYRAK